MTETSLLFVTPAFKRFELTKLCLEQRRWACDELGRRYGLRASCVVIASDRNLKTARELDFYTVNRDNAYLGRRFNDGYTVAHAAGFSHVFAIGSDSWIDPDYFETLPGPHEVKVSRRYAVIPPEGDRRGEMTVTWIGGVAFTVPTRLYAERRYRPCGEYLANGCDTSTWQRARLLRHRRVYREGHPLELVAFYSPESQISSYDRLMEAYGTQEIVTRPFDALREHYPARMVERMQELYAARTWRAAA